MGMKAKGVNATCQLQVHEHAVARVDDAATLIEPELLARNFSFIDELSLRANPVLFKDRLLASPVIRLSHSFPDPAPMQPKPMAETSRSLFPSLRVLIVIPLYRFPRTLPERFAKLSSRGSNPNRKPTG